MLRISIPILLEVTVMQQDYRARCGRQVQVRVDRWARLEHKKSTVASPQGRNGALFADANGTQQSQASALAFVFLRP